MSSKSRTVAKKVTLTSDEETHLTSEEDVTQVQLSDEDQYYEEYDQNQEMEDENEYEYEEYEES